MVKSIQNYISEITKLSLIPSQDELLNLLKDIDIKNLAITAGRGYSKTMLSAGSALWFADEYCSHVHKDLEIIIVSSQKRLYWHLDNFFRMNRDRFDSRLMQKGLIHEIPEKGFVLLSKDGQNRAIVHPCMPTSTSVRSNRADILFIDECAEIPKDIIVAAQGCLTGDICKIVLLSTPHKEGYFTEVIADPKKYKYKLFVASAEECPWQEESNKRAKASLTKEEYAREILGRPPTKAERSVFSSEGIEKCITNTSTSPEGGANSFLECYDKYTEVLTEYGWKLFKDVTIEDNILTLNKDTFNMEYQKPTELIEREADRILDYKNKSLSFGVTVNHNMFVLSHHNRVYKNNTNFEFREACNLDYSSFVKRDGIWNGNNNFKVVLSSWKKCNNHNDDIIIENDENFIKFLGWFISEGCVNRDSYKIGISQSLVHPIERKEIKNVLDLLPFNYGINGNNYQIGSKQLGDWLNSNCYNDLHEKVVPNFIKYLSSKLIRLFLDTFFLGDGSLCSNKVTKLYFAGTSKELADDLQELILKAGRYAVIYIQQPKGLHKYADRIINSTSITYLVSEYGLRIYGKIKKPQLEIKEYNGKVYCLTVPNHIIYVRRDGMPMWCGNCGIDWGFASGTSLVITERIGTVKRKVIFIKIWKDKPIEIIAPEVAGVLNNFVLKAIKADSRPTMYQGKVEKYTRKHITYIDAPKKEDENAVSHKRQMVGQLTRKIREHQLIIPVEFKELIEQLRKYRKGMSRGDDLVDALALSCYEPAIPLNDSHNIVMFGGRELTKKKLNYLGY